MDILFYTLKKDRNMNLKERISKDFFGIWWGEDERCEMEEGIGMQEQRQRTCGKWAGKIPGYEIRGEGRDES